MIISLNHPYRFSQNHPSSKIYTSQSAQIKEVFSDASQGDSALSGADFAMVFIGSIFANWVEGLFESPEDFIPWSFALLAIPGLFLKFAGDFAEKPRYDWRRTDMGRTVYRVGGIVIYILIVQMVRGVDLTAWL